MQPDHLVVERQLKKTHSTTWQRALVHVTTCRHDRNAFRVFWERLEWIHWGHYIKAKLAPSLFFIWIFGYEWTFFSPFKAVTIKCTDCSDLPDLLKHREQLVIHIKYLVLQFLANLWPSPCLNGLGFSNFIDIWCFLTQIFHHSDWLLQLCIVKKKQKCCSLMI